MLTQHIALVPEVTGVNPSELARVSAALQKQVVRDLSPIWGISATVDPFPHLEDVPIGYWPIILAFGELGSDEGIHIDNRGQPYALIEMTPSWSLAASHVCLEMLVDPFGSRTVTGASPRSDQGTVDFLVDVCHPCEDARFAYTVNDVLVSDFCTPEFLSQVPSPKERYSFTGAIQAPFQILPGGRLTWYDPATNKWWQRNHFGGSARDTDLGFIERRLGRVREIINPDAPRHLQATKLALEAYEERMGIPRQRALRASQSQAHLLRVHLGNPSGRGELRLESARTSVVDPSRFRVGESERPQVLAALLRASIGPGKESDVSSFLEHAITAGVFTTDAERAPEQRPPPARQQTERLFRDDESPFGRTLESATDRDEPFRTANTEPGTARRSAVQGRRPHAARVTRDQHETQPTLRRTGPPPLPRPSPPPYHPPSRHRMTDERVVPPSLAPTALPVSENPIRPSSSLRDSVLLIAAVAAAGLGAMALYGTGGSPNGPVNAAAGPGPTLPAASQVAPSTQVGAEGTTAPRASVDPVTLAPAPSPPRAPADNQAAVGPRAPRPKGVTGAKAANPAPPTTSHPSSGDSLDLLVEERR